MINLIFSPIYKAIALTQKIISIIVVNWWFFLIASLAGITFEEAFYGLRIIKYLGLI